ncbi:hypothetical protein [Rathayibacter rathayi]|uniref:Integrase n=1 Tax=Rathayibacter rathayi TaxID=33887 RepID=A0ABD6WAM1_RATRA|nr:hypothetical protein [Rathayibacter rathayi]AZZ48827.1 hypothetical protein C1O28_06155 [Rathayibacter rathayi]MWV73919.1 hypothetical protein [Rathayibacter rathayi NCPPB 2980 = VKM Ac-1601]PPF15390.1 hypothetical protein C5C04_03965 [Rathayibacter rathayi]PPF24804.1 hypothetical protein C5C34_04640 [Rathayibacter rathayi]PPF48827.1 hypothetical protein C5C08_08480 [Rathayibacter rathayi]
MDYIQSASMRPEPGYWTSRYVAAERLNVASIRKRPNGTWRARYRDADGKEHARHFRYKDNPKEKAQSAQHWLDWVTASVVRGDYLDPDTARMTVGAV